MSRDTAPRLGRPVLLLAAALLVTRVGAAAAYVGVALQVWRVTHSAAWETAAMVATLGLSGVVPLLTSPLADRFDRRRVMVASQTLSAATWAVLAANHAPLALVALGLLSVVVESPFMVAVDAAIPNLVDDRALDRANAVVSFTTAASWLVGPLLAAALLAGPGVGAVFLLNAVSSAVAALLIARVRGSFRTLSDDPSEMERTGSALEGLKVVSASPLLRVLLAAWFLATLGFDGVNVAFPPLAEQHGAGATGYAAGLVGWGLGLSVGSAIGSRLDRATERKGLTVALVVAGAGLTTMGLVPTWVAMPAATALTGLGFGCAFVADSCLVQRATPDAVRARVRAVLNGAGTLASLASLALAGALLALAGPASFPVAGGVVVVLAAVPLLRRRSASVQLVPAA
ncbi:MAG: MFS transporter [Motilibacteraceae bacterium]